MTPTRAAVTLALTSALVLGGCSTDDGDSGSTADSGTDDQAASASSVPDGSSATTTDEPPNDADRATATADGDRGVVGADEAADIASELLTTAATRKHEVPEIGAEPAELRSTYRAAARKAAFAEDRAQPVTGEIEPRDEDEPVTPTVLAVSRVGSPEQLILTQTPGQGDQPPTLTLITRADEQDDWKIAWGAPMLPGTEIGTFDRRSDGTPVLDEQALRGAGLTEEPNVVLGRLAASLDYPLDPDRPEILTNGLAPAVRKAADAQADAVAAQATLTQRNTVREDNRYDLQLQDGSVLTFAVLERDSILEVNQGMEVTAPDLFELFSGDGSITDRAQLDTMVFVAVHVPLEGEGNPEVLAAREQPWRAQGS